jgi:hypothetical protein
LNQANESCVFAPQPTPFACKASTSACDADVLAGEASADKIDSAESAELVAVDSSDVWKARDVWPVLGKDGAAVGLDFAERDGSHSGSFESEAESADAAE